MWRNGRDSDTSESDSGDNHSSDDQVDSVPCHRPVLRKAQLVVMETGDMNQILETQAAQQQALNAMVEEQARVAAEQARNAAATAASVELAKLQAVTCGNIQKDIASIERFVGEVGALNHFLRSGDRVTRRIEDREQSGRLDKVDADSLRSALVLRVQQGILNLLQADETTTWETLRKRLQKEYGGGRWTPDEDALRLLRITRGPRQSKGEFAAVLLRQYGAVVDKYRETLTGAQATAKIGYLEELVKVQLGEAIDGTVTGSVVEEANKLIDAAGREEAREARDRKPEWRPRPRPEGPRYPEARREAQRNQEPRRRAEMPQGKRSSVVRPGMTRRDDRRCYGCGRRGHLQAKCPDVKCYECNTPGHFARNCPYMRPQRRQRDEPMEVNYHGPESRRRGRRQEPRRDEPDTDGSEGASGETTDSEDAPSTYAAVVKEVQPSRSRGGSVVGERR